MELDRLLVRHVFATLQAHGWREGVGRVIDEIEAASDARRADSLRFLIAWLAAERGHWQDASHWMDSLSTSCGHAGWRKACDAFVAIRRADYVQADSLLDAADSCVSIESSLLGIVIGHLRGVMFLRQNRFDLAQHALAQEIEQASRSEFLTGRILDSLGNVFMAKDNFYAARESFDRSLQKKRDCGDDAGIALTCGNLGRLYFSWGLLDQAEYYFNEDLTISAGAGDEFGKAVMHNWLGRVALERGDYSTSERYLRHSIGFCRRLQLSHVEGHARKDLAHVLLMQDRLDRAEGELKQSQQLFEEIDSAEGLARVAVVSGILRGARGDYGAALEELRAAGAYFCQAELWSEAASSTLQSARTLRLAGAERDEVVQEFRAALELAESCHRDRLIMQIERELRDVDEIARLHLIYRRVRGRGVTEDTISLFDGTREPTSILFLDIEGSTDYGMRRDPDIVLLEFNQMMAEFEKALVREEAIISGYRGDGFMAMFRGRDIARRSVSAALDLLRVLEDFNLPRRILGKPQFKVRIGISTGDVCNGNVGTYHKMDFTSIGASANLAARLQSSALPGLPCVCQETRRLVSGMFHFTSDSPRSVVLKGFGTEPVFVWDVAGR